jgi:hypothetical protein
MSATIWEKVAKIRGFALIANDGAEPPVRELRDIAKGDRQSNADPTHLGRVGMVGLRHDAVLDTIEELCPRLLPRRASNNIHH